jgi:xylan 1,4-beta-xylosidase
VFEYGGIISPPKDWDRWGDLIRALVAHLLERYGDEVLGWDFEVWNEANLDVFWSGTREEWMRLYDVTVRAVKDVDPRIAVGGPSSAAAGWVDALLEHARKSGAPVDFVSTHTYGSPPLDLRPTLERYGLPDARILWTEWGVTPTHFHPVNDGTSAATFLLSGMRSAAGRVDALSYWVASDHFEELGRPPRLLHGGFGLITVGGIAKPRYHALRMLARLGDTELAVRGSGDGAGGLVQSWASRHENGRLTVLLWASTLDQSKRDGDPALARRVRLALSGAAGGAVTVTRLDRDHGDITTLARELGIADWPTDEQWTALRAADSLAAEPVAAEDVGGAAVVDLHLPQPGAVLVEVA